MLRLRHWFGSGCGGACSVLTGAGNRTRSPACPGVSWRLAAQLSEETEQSQRGVWRELLRVKSPDERWFARQARIIRLESAAADRPVRETPDRDRPVLDDAKFQMAVVASNSAEYGH